MSTFHSSLTEVAHRPWPLPQKPWAWQQSWLDLAFLHYRVAPEIVAPRLPAGVRLQQFDGSAWLGVVPFRMANVGPRALQRFFSFADFPELNLRTYVEADGKPGVWFFSLDAASRLIVFGGRRFFGLPYFHATMEQTRHREWLSFRSARHGSVAGFRGRYRATGARLRPAPDSFEHWATERYALYVLSPRGTLQRMQVHHVPWPLHRAEVHLEDTSVIRAAGFDTTNESPICHYSPGVHVVSFDPEPVG